MMRVLAQRSRWLVRLAWAGVTVLALLQAGVVTALWAIAAGRRVFGTCLNLWLATPVLASLGTESVAARLGVLVSGIAVFATGCAIYVGAHLGSGPRDGLMLAIHLRLPLGVGGARVLSEGIGLGIGWSLGGPAGVGTLLFVVAAGPMLALAFRFLGLQPLAGARSAPRAS